ncbi:MAG: Trk system potassium transporter TrkA [Lachnospiraceae bacterium]|nr:Trk system potassium transporter TrkA [Lachnospiraceae bacterium]
MNIIIIGCGKVGITLAETLSAEKHNISLIDTSAEVLSNIPETLDALRTVGNGASFTTLQEAGIEKADLMIAVTASDELNLLCCLVAKKVVKCQTIARVRNPVYNRELGFIKEKMGISMIINPELTAATEIVRLLRFPSAIKIDTFAKGRVELLKFRLKPEFKLHNVPVHRLAARINTNILICAVERGNEVTIPDGNFILQDNDMLSIIASPIHAAEFFQYIGLKTNQVKNAMIVGGGTVGYYAAKQLLHLKIDTRIVEISKKRCEELSELLPDASIICGDGTDRQLLLEEGLGRAEAFVPLTGMDEENILLSLFAKSNTDAKLVTKVNRLSFTDIINNLDIGSVIYPKNLTADYILRYVRAMSNSIGSNVETLYQILDGRAEALEFTIREKSAVTDTPLARLSLKKNILIGCIHRSGKIRIPRGQDSIQVGDSVIVVTTQKGLNDIQDILEK